MQNRETTEEVYNLRHIMQFADTPGWAYVKKKLQERLDMSYNELDRDPESEFDSLKRDIRLSTKKQEKEFIEQLFDNASKRYMKIATGPRKHGIKP